jgi:hypothetical protein
MEKFTVTKQIIAALFAESNLKPSPILRHILIVIQVKDLNVHLVEINSRPSAN